MEPTSAARDPAKKEDALLKSEEVKPSASVEATQPATEEVEEFPDPDEDDLDDLDGTSPLDIGKNGDMNLQLTLI